MDSRIKLAEKQSREWASAVSNDYDHESPKWANDLARQQKEERDALLTAEPEPCEDAKKIATDIRCMSRWDAEKGAALIEAYASKAADKRVEELRALREALEPFADAECEDERYSDEDNPQLLSCEEYGKPRAEWCAVCNAKQVLAATEPKPSAKEN